MYRALRPALFLLDPERAHELAIRFARFVAVRPKLLAWFRSHYAPEFDASMRTNVLGIEFPSPLGLAAGLDKNGDAIDFWSALGFGFVELGTVTPGAGQPGNEGRRIERLVQDAAIINRLGFNNRGAAYLASRLAARNPRVIAGANIGKARHTPADRTISDYVLCFKEVWPVSDYITVNVSSPNTPGLRDLQAVDALRALLSELVRHNEVLSREHERPPRPLLVKIAPDLDDDDIDAVAEVALDLRIAGIIATNTTIRGAGLRSRPKIEGGISGRPLATRALEVTKHLFRRVGNELIIVGVGGIFSAEDAYRRMRAGARLVQVYTAFVYEGPKLASSIVRGLSELLMRDGVKTIAEIVGVDA